MKYLLFVYPCDENWNKEESNQIFAEELVQIIKDETLKFVYGENHTIFNFESDMSQSEIDIYIKLLKEEVPDFMYVLVQNAKGVSSDMDKNNLEHLMGKKKRGRKPKTKNPINDFVTNIPKPTFDIKSFLDEHNKKMAEFLKNNVCDLTLDEILDKIIDQGMESLTSAEKDKLDEYSKK
jgi:hypothetical protein